MTATKMDKGPGSIGWAVLTPVILLAAAFSVVGIVAIPALCVALDRRTNSVVAGASVAAVSLLLPLVYGPLFAGLSAFILIASTTMMLCSRRNLPFGTGLAISAGGGVLGMVAALALTNYLMTSAMDVALADSILKFLANHSNGVQASLLDSFVLSFQMMQGNVDLLDSSLWDMMRAVQSMAVTAKVEAIRADMEMLMAQALPALALIAGLVSGGLGYYLGCLNIRRQDRRAGRTPMALPPFRRLRFPNYLVFSLVILQLISMFGVGEQWSYFEPVNVAATWLLDLMMVAQAVTLCSFYLTRWRVSPGLQVLILVLGTLPLSSLLFILGLADVVFDFRAIAGRIDTLGKGPPPPPPAGGRPANRPDKHNNDGED